MIISRSPLRISLGGGGTDLPSYYQHFGGFLIAAAIDKYVYVTANKRFSKGISLKYSQIEEVQDANNIKHPIIRESLLMMGVREVNLEITTLADIPSGTGLGSSGSFTTALLKTLSTIKRTSTTPDSLAKMACDVEIYRLGEPIGKQDQYVASFGGISCFTFHKDHTVSVEPLNIKNRTLVDLEDNLMLFFTGYSRSASSILKDQNAKCKEWNSEMLENLHFIKDMAFKSKAALEKGDLLEFGELMHQHWEHKKNRSKGMSNPQIDEWYKLGLKNGAVGGKVVGAGGGGFLLFYAEDKNKLRTAFSDAGLEEVRFGFDFEGTKTLVVS